MSTTALLCAIDAPAATPLAAALDAAGAVTRCATNAADTVAAIRETLPDVIAVALLGPDAGTARPLVAWLAHDWMAAADTPIFDLLALLNGLRDAIGERAATIVLVGPEIGQTGAVGHVALSAMVEGQRGLMKTLARQWGPALRFAWAGVWPPLLLPDIDVAALPEQPELGPYVPPAGGRPGWSEVAETVLALARLARASTGQSVLVDGGEWMLP